MGLDTKWTDKPWDVDTYEKLGHNLEITDADNLKVVETAAGIQIKYHGGAKSGQEWAKCTYVPFQERTDDTPEVLEHLEGEIGDKKFNIYFDTPKQLTCETPEDGGGGAYTAWTAVEGT